MCTSIAWRRGSSYFGRTLDLECSYGEQVVVTPRGYPIQLRNGGEVRTRWGLIGMGLVVQDHPFYYEACNEQGLAIAGLNFPESAVYLPPQEGKTNLAVFELIPWLLGQASTVAEARGLLAEVNLTDQAFSSQMPLSPLHFMVSDRRESLVAEPTAEGLKLYDNPCDVMTNEPPFSTQLWNLRQYRRLSPANGPTDFTDRYPLPDFAVGMGAFGLPGDASSPSRFVRAAYHLANSRCEDTDAANVSQFFHVLDSVSMVKGATLTSTGKDDITVYTCCMDLDKGIYYYTTYDNHQITALRMDHADLDGDKLTVYPLCRTQQLRCDN